METNNAVKATPVKPYDASAWDNWSLYDNMPYIWNPDLNLERDFKYETGNIIKGYRCKITDSIEIKHD